MNQQGSTVVVIGAGAAGLVLAKLLSDRSVQVILLESGARRPSSDQEELNRVHVVGTPHRGVHEGRVRAWAGSTTRWGGQLWAWDAYEFLPRPEVGISGWPIAPGEITRFYDKALALLGVTEAAVRQAEEVRRKTLLLLESDLLDLKFSVWLPWRKRNLANTVGSKLRSRENVTVLLQSTAIAVLVDQSGRKARGVRVQDADGQVREIAADVVIVAAGTIETVRLLLLSSQQAPGTAFGNQGDWLGRGFMDHLSVRVGRFRPKDLHGFSRIFAPFHYHGFRYTPRIVLRPALRTQIQVLAAYGHWETELSRDTGTAIVRDKLRMIQSRRVPHLSVRELAHALTSAGEILRLLGNRVLGLRQPFTRETAIYLRVDTEQVANPDSRITLANDKDRYGTRRAILDWRITDLEQETVRQVALVLQSELQRLDIGSVDLDPDPFASSSRWGAAKGDSFHMMGGTRMAREPSEGVVDTDLRVFGTDNLYVASASVFPTGGMANPTLTLVALCLRLADHLAPGATA